MTSSSHDPVPVHTSTSSGLHVSDTTDTPISDSGVERGHEDVGDQLVRHESVDDAQSLASIDHPPSDEKRLPASRAYGPYELPVIFLLAPASMLGLLARLGLEALATYQGESIFPLAYVQALGCFVMGFGLELKEPFGRFYGPLYTALTTGFCGSLTTFSSWQLDVWDSWVNINGAHRAGIRDVMDGVTKTVFTLCMALFSIQAGAHMASLIRPHIRPLPPPNKTVRFALLAISILMYAAAFPAYFRLPSIHRHQATAALLFSFPGTLTRYLLSINLNTRLKLFPLGTFTANMFGTALLGTFRVLQGKPTPVSPNACALLQGLSDGYCGCLTTVSTFAAEVKTLKEWKAWLYVALSWTGGQLLLLVIQGSSFWAGNVSKTVTCRYV